MNTVMLLGWLVLVGVCYGLGKAVLAKLDLL